MKKFEHYLENEQATQNIAGALANFCYPPLLITLSGELGSGKTTFIRALLRQLGVIGAIKSPTYSLVEIYQVGDLNIFHFDLYRLAAEEELELIGWRDYLSQDAILLIEWPEKAASLLPPADMVCQLTILEQGRKLKINAESKKGDKILSQFLQQQERKEK